MRVIKIGEKYLGWVESQQDAIRFSSDAAQTRTIAGSLNAGIYMAGLTGSRVVKLKTHADQTGDAMRGLADDINNG